MGYGYVIGRSAGTDVVPETERRAAIAELREMGYEIEVSSDRREIRQKRIARAPHLDNDTARKHALRMMSLLQSVHGHTPPPRNPGEIKRILSQSRPSRGFTQLRPTT
jgi:hypothetical protein